MGFREGGAIGAPEEPAGFPPPTRKSYIVNRKSARHCFPARYPPPAMPDAIGSTPPPLSKAKIFWRRLTSFVVLWTIVLTAMFSRNRLVSDYVFLVIMVLLAALGLAEFYGLVAKRGWIVSSGGAFWAASC